MPTPEIAARLAGALLAPLGNRWTHTQAVAARARSLADAVEVEDRDLLEVAAWWHDPGYAPGLVESGMHQIDGARFLRDMDYPVRLVSLVAHHSAAEFEAQERGLVHELRYWRRESSAVADALWTADMSTGPRGEDFDYSTRLREILNRYDETSSVARAMRNAEPTIQAAIARTEGRINRAR